MLIVILQAMKPLHWRALARLVLESELTHVEVTSTGCQLIHFLLMLVLGPEVGGLAGSSLVVLIHIYLPFEVAEARCCDSW